MAHDEQVLDGWYAEGEGQDRVEYRYKNDELVGAAGLDPSGKHYFAVWMDGMFHRAERKSQELAREQVDKMANKPLTSTAMYSAERDARLRAANCPGGPCGECGGVCTSKNVA